MPAPACFGHALCFIIPRRPESGVWAATGRASHRGRTTFDLLWLSVAAYLLLQAVVSALSCGPARWVAAAPLAVMIPIGVLTALADAQESNLWPLWLLMASPVALLYVAAVGAFLLAARKQSGA